MRQQLELAVSWLIVLVVCLLLLGALAALVSGLGFFAGLLIWLALVAVVILAAIMLKGALIVFLD